MCAAIYLRPVALSFVNIIVDQIWLKATIFGLLMKKFKNCLKLYLSFECWVDEPHPRLQVKQFLEALGILINLIKEFSKR